METNGPIYRWRVGAVEITRVLEFEAALFEPAVISPRCRLLLFLDPGQDLGRVRTRLAAGGKQIRTDGPTYA
jgi:hypothetical protein